jgi:hypothetical protein
VKRLRWLLYAIGLTLLSAIWLGKLGFYDPKFVQIDDIVIEKPLWYLNPVKHKQVTLSNDDTESLIFPSNIINNGALYTIHKTTDPERYRFRTLMAFELNTSNVNDCYLAQASFEIKDADKILRVIRRIDLYKYPYEVSFDEISQERENRMIEQICGNGKRIKTKRRESTPIHKEIL